MAEDILIERTSHEVKNLDSVRLLANQVLVKAITDNKQSHTQSGIIKTADNFWKNQFLAAYVDRVYTVVKVCDKLTFWSPTNKTSGNCLRWKCDMDVDVGDTIWVSYPSAINYTAIICKNIEYKLINYEEIRMSQKPDGLYVMVNGYNLYRHPQKSRSTILIDPKPVTEYDKGEIIIVGKKNHSYIVNEKSWRDLDGDYNIQVGDVFVKNNIGHTLLLEDSLFNVYPEKNVFVMQKKDMVVILK